MGNPLRLPPRWGAWPLAAALFALLASACLSATTEAEHLSRGCRQGHRVALTFDDGPNPPYTDEILKILSEHQATATFFDEGELVEANPELVTRELAAGMAVGSHSYAHATDLPALDRPAFARDLERAEQALTPLLGYKPGLYRAPYGHTSQKMLDELRAQGYVSIGWDIDSADWSAAPVDEIVSNVVDKARPGDIILMHDGGLGGGNPDRSATIAALPRILDGLTARGYAFATVPELTGAPSANGRGRRPMCSGS